MKTILDNPKALLKDGKSLPYGIYSGLIADAHTSFWDVEGFFPKRRRSQRKCWIYFGSFSPDLYLGFAIADAGFISTAFCYFYIPSLQLFVEDKTTLPLGFKENFDPNLFDDWKLGAFQISSQGKKISISYKGKFELNASCIENENGFSFVCPSEGRPFNYTYKNLLLPTKINIKYKGKTYNSEGNSGGLDFSKGYPPKQTVWKWASVTGQTASGKPIAINLVSEHNANMENAVWLDGKRIIVSDATFQKEAPFDKNPWYIKTNDGILDIEFTPQGARSENINIIAMKSIFTQPYGQFKGKISIDGQEEVFTGFGVVEDHLAVW